jgi:hypothetical protein
MFFANPPTHPSSRAFCHPSRIVLDPERSKLGGLIQIHHFINVSSPPNIFPFHQLVESKVLDNFRILRFLMQGANILPRCDPLKRLGFEKQINMDSSRLLRFEMLHGGENFKNEEYRKEASEDNIVRG